MDIVRTIHMNIDEHPNDITPSRAGHSIGRWEGDTLVVDTLGFSEGFLRAGGGGLAKHSDRMHSVERFTYDAETQGLTRSYTAEDPLYFEGVYTGPGHGLSVRRALRALCLRGAEGRLHRKLAELEPVRSLPSTKGCLRMIPAAYAAAISHVSGSP